MTDVNKNNQEEKQYIGEYGDLTPEQSIELAAHTERRIKNKSLDDILSLDVKSINLAMALIQSDKFRSIEIKTILNNLLEMIVDLSSLVRELYNWQSQSQLRNVWGNEMYKIDASTSNTFADQIQLIQDQLTEKHSNLMSSQAEKDPNTNETIKKIIRSIVTESGMILEGCEGIEDSVKTAINEIREYSILTPYMNQPKNVDFEEFVEEIRVDDYNDIRIVRGGREQRTNLTFRSPEHALLFAQKLIRSSDQPGSFSKDKPFLRVRVGATTRVSLMRDPIAIRDPELVVGDNRPVVHMCIRRQRSDPFTINKLIELGSINKYGSMLLRTLVRSGISMCFYGGTGSGKTSMFNAFIYTKERMITMAEIDEMKARIIDYRRTIEDPVTKKEIRNPNYRKAINSTLMWESTDLNKPILGELKGFQGMANAALTMTPYTVMIQETKGAEANDLVELAISDHQVMTTIHAKDEKVLINRIFKMLQQGGNNSSEDVIFRDIVTAFPVVVACSRLKDGKRKISSIVEYMGYIPTTKEVVTNTMCKFKVERNTYENGKLKVIGDFQNYALPSPALREEMERRGLIDEEWVSLQTEFRNTSTAKPPGMDKTIYDGDLYSVGLEE